MSQHQETAARVGLTISDLDSLIAGKITANVRRRIARSTGLTIGDLEGFIQGSPSIIMTHRLGLQTRGAAETLAKSLGHDGAAGFLVGLCFVDL